VSLATRIAISPWTRARLACPYDGEPLIDADAGLACAQGHTHRVVDGVPILLRRDIPHPHHVADHALTVTEDGLRRDGDGTRFDPFVQEAIAATGGLMYRPLLGRLTAYPIPELRLPPGGGRSFLDLGCNWGRWTIAAARAGYRAIGIDPSIEGVRAARRAAARLGIEIDVLVADARYPPFAAGSLDTVFSYSVLQHLSKAAVATCLEGAARVLAPGGRAVIQMPNAWGVRSLFHQARRGFQPPQKFEVRYWTVAELKRTFEQFVGPAHVTVDGFFSLNPQPAEAHMLPRRFRAVVAVSEALRRASVPLPLLTYLADSVYVESRRP
jgi:SAM-dependent methyltransferase